MIFTPTSIEVRPAKLTREYAVTSSPTWIGSLKSTLSTDTVTHCLPAWRIAATAATRSAIARITPPNTLPMMFACCGVISSDITVSDSRGCLGRSISSPRAGDRTPRSRSGTAPRRWEPALPVGRLEPALHLVHLLAREAARHHVLRPHAADQVVEDPVHLV